MTQRHRRRHRRGRHLHRPRPLRPRRRHRPPGQDPDHPRQPGHRRPRRPRPGRRRPRRIDLIIHGTTTTTNAVLERRLARTGLITTQGFRDVLELGRRTRPNPYGMTGRFTPVIPRDLRLEVPERTDARGRILTPLDEAAVRAAVAHLLAAGLRGPRHPLPPRLRQPRPRSSAPPPSPPPSGPPPTSPPATPSSPSPASTSAASPPPSTPRCSPILERYLTRLQSELTARGYPRDLLVVTGNGGMVSARTVAREAAKTVMSGPASGVMAATTTARRAGIANLITYDMGGTSTDVALIRDGAPPVSSEIELEYAMPIHVPMVDVRTVGAGGGSIARLTPSGLLEVGPDSAGADPGPIASGRGGTPPHHHRRQPPPRPPRPRPLPRHRRRPPHPHRHHRPPPRPHPRGRRRRHPPHRRHPHVERHPHGLALPRRRPPRLHPLRLRRRRPAPRRRPRPRARHPPRPRPRPPRPRQRARLRHRRPPLRLRPHPRPPPRRPRHRARSTPSSPPTRPRAAP